MKKKILVAVDGSVYSSNSLDYLIRLFRENDAFDIDLFAAVSAGSKDQSWMNEVDPHRIENTVVLQRKAIAAKYLKDARMRLVRNGFAKENITSIVHASSQGITGSIYHFAKENLYDGILVGRRGVGRVGEMLLGSVSADLVRQCHEIPIWIIDGNVTSTRFLLAVHTCIHSLMAADHLSFILKDNPTAEVCIYHSRSAFGSTPSHSSKEEYHHYWGERWCDKNLDLETCLYKAHSQVLIQNGFPKERIIHITPRRGIHPSHDLLRQAKRYQCGTIAIGRRPRVDKGLFGGVSDRITRKAQNMAIWLVG
ncbi:MAG: universal stress protein [Candidatus Electrothrix sp. AW2]|jgi:nucleotide-binding universal stress UspA family protein|nr:universal stress protein [Candidatus Electrothrix gigas]MCI5126960.1 universal stress protein [Candidatus Electrothrix gigas]MCI5134541.1 universal stress protein [Candidatus Electrothrix gigas]MCI5178605.1 universal stress protein [Candidatus Electrothrix gigas]MCI5193028.1 universal stress protein [Candidatus Electrothrix gigas]